MARLDAPAADRSADVVDASGHGEGPAAKVARAAPFRIYVKNWHGDTLRAKVANSGEWVGDLKARIGRVEREPPQYQLLIFQGVELEDEQTVAGCGLCSDCNVQLVVRRKRRISPPEPFELYVKTIDGRMLTLSGVDRSETIDDLKARIQAIRGFTPDQQRIMCVGHQLDGERTVEYYGLSHGDVLHMVLHLVGC